MAINLTFAQRRFVQQQFEQFSHRVQLEHISPIYRVLEFREEPPPIVAYRRSIDAAQNAFQQATQNDQPFVLDDALAARV